MGVIALTGGIATGKSTVAAMLAQRGARVVDADLLAREVVAPGTEGLAEVVARFGREVLGGDGGLDRDRLGAIVFADPEQRRALEAITHPRIRVLTAERIAQALADDVPLVVVDIPLYFETARDGMMPVLLVYADEPTQLRRLMERSGLDEVAARRRIEAQLPIDEKRSRATWVIDNSGDIAATERAVAAWWDEHVATARA